MPDIRHAIIIIAVMGAVTLATRILPVLIFGRGEKIPDFILYLGKVIPYTAMGLLLVYCLRNVSVTGGSHGLPELIALLAVAVSYIFRRNTVLSVIIGTVLYMFLVQKVF
ncbi:MAG: AzlD domain-containing protein [Lachnospiraceae bacterium]|nr:AzlD domain-containing protein [Lachnospiraceae bacterium]